MAYRESFLDNGIRILTEEVSSVRSISLGFWLSVGSRDESADQRGLSHFIEHMSFKGTPRRSAGDISASLDGLGAEYNAFTSKEYTCYYARFVDDKLPKVFDILSDMVMNSSFEQSDIDSERKVILEEIARSEDEPDDQVFEIFGKGLIPEHSLSYRVLGDAELVAAFQHEDFVSYHREHYVGNRLTVCASGNISHEALLQLCEEHMAHMPSGDKPNRTQCTLQYPLKLVSLKKDIEQAHLVLGMPALSASHPDKYALSILDNAFGGGMSSRLFVEIREKRGLAYSVFCGSSRFTDIGSFYMYAGTRPSNLKTLLDLFNEELSKLAQDGLTEEEFIRSRDCIEGNLILGMESTRERMKRLGHCSSMGTDILSLDEIIASYKAVSMDDIDRLAKQLIQAPRTLSIVSPFDEEELKSICGDALL